MSMQIESLKKLSKLEESIGSGDRIARLLVKTTTDKITGIKTVAIEGRKTEESMAVIVPRASVAMVNVMLNDVAGKQWLLEQIESLQDGLIRKAYGAGKNAIFEEQIGIGALLAAIQANESAGRFSKESIGVWFDADLAGLLRDAISHRLIGISQDKLDKTVAGYRSDFQILASREVFMQPELKVKLQKALNLLPDDYESEYAITAEKVFQKFAVAGTKASAIEDVL